MRQDVVAGAVDDPLEPHDPVARQGFAEDAHDGDPAADRSLEGEVDAPGDRALDERRAVHRQQHLVRGHDAAPGVDRALDVPARRVHAAHHLDEDVDRRVSQDGLGIGREPGAVELRDALLVHVSNEDARDLERSPDALREILGVGAQEVHHAATHGAASQEADPDRIHRAAVYYTRPMTRALHRGEEDGRAAKPPQE